MALEEGLRAYEPASWTISQRLTTQTEQVYVNLGVLHGSNALQACVRASRAEHLDPGPILKREVVPPFLNSQSRHPVSYKSLLDQALQEPSLRTLLGRAQILE